MVFTESTVDRFLCGYCPGWERVQKGRTKIGDYILNVIALDSHLITFFPVPEKHIGSSIHGFAVVIRQR